MEILSEQEMAARLDYMKLLKQEPEVDKREPLYCIPFEYGDNPKGTKISKVLAKTIAAELLMHVAESDKREIFRAFKQEQERVESYGRQVQAANDEKYAALSEVAFLKRKLNRLRRGK